MDITQFYGFKVSLVILAIALASLVAHLIAPNIEIIEGWPTLSAVLIGLVLVGLTSLVASVILPEQCRQSQRVTVCPCRGGDCRGTYCPPGGAAATELVVFIMIAVLIYFTVIGVIRAVVFTYESIHKLARGGAERLETTVLDIGEVTRQHATAVQVQGRGGANDGTGNPPLIGGPHVV